jgi:hypothetical protein
MARKYKQYKRSVRRIRPRPSNRFHDEGRYCDYKGNVPTKPVGPADWLFLAIFAAIGIALWIFVL